MKKICVFLFLIILSLNASSFEYQMKINDSLAYMDKTINLVNIGTNGIIVDVSGVKATISVENSQEFDKLFVIPRSVFYVKEADERFAVIDFCEKKEEICNNLDDDCDGAIDENVDRDCGLNTGICEFGTQKCVEGEWGYCLKAVFPQNEICNGLDDNCDGEVDEELKRECGNSPTTGKCSRGVQYCEDDEWTECSGQIFPTPENCNNQDDDCDGKIDEELVKDCGVSNLGLCTQTKITCEKGKWDECDPVLPALEECDNKDNDCDGKIDEELFRQCGDSDLGICSLGEEICSGGKWGSCAGAIYPTTEWCDNADNDCDGTIDEDCKNKNVFNSVIDWFKNLF